MRSWFLGLSLRKKIYLSLILPVAGFFFSGCWLVWQQMSIVEQTRKVDRIVALSVSDSRLVHEMQRERGMSGVFLNSHGAKFREELSAQRVKTDAGLAELTRLLAQNDEGLQAAGSLRQIAQSLSGLTELRGQVDGQSIAAPECLRRYTQSVTVLLNWVDKARGEVRAPDMVRRLGAYSLLLRYKEMNGQERAVGASIFAQGKGNEALLVQYFSVRAQARAYLERTILVVDEAQSAQLQSLEKSPEAEQVHRYEQEIVDHLFTGGMTSSAAEWFAASTGYIDRIHAQETGMTDAVLAESAGMMRRAKVSLLALLVGILLVLAIALWSSHAGCEWICRAMRRVLGRATEIAKGDLSGAPLPSDSDEEIGRMACAMNAMQNSLKELICAMGNGADLVAENSRSLSAAATRQSEHAVEQARQVEQIVYAVQQIGDAVERIDTLVHAAMDESQQSAVMATQASQAVDGNLESLREIAASSTRLSVQVTSLGENSEKIGSAANVIEDIAGQTNLLALNANIEAARAGVHGRGFAIVANEVRQLADRTSKATESISSLIESIQTETRQAVDSIHTDTERVQKGVQETETVPTMMRNIIGASERIGGVVSDVAHASQQQMEAMRQIRESVETIRQMSQQNTQAAREGADACTHLTRLTEEMRDHVQNFSYGTVC